MRRLIRSKYFQLHRKARKAFIRYLTLVTYLWAVCQIKVLSVQSKIWLHIFVQCLLPANNKTKLQMIDLFQDRKIFLNAKKRGNNKGCLPDLKYSPLIGRKAHQDVLAAGDNSRIVYGYQPLSNILVSKKLSPPNPEQLSLLMTKKKNQPTKQHNFKIRKESVKKITDKQEQVEEQQRNSTSLSHRARIKESDAFQLILDDSKLTKVIRTDELTFAVVKGNNNQDLIRQILLDRKIWKEVKFGQAIPNFKWVFYKDRHNFKKMWSFTQKRIINHFQFSQEISTKDSLVRNLQIYCETKKIELFSVTPVTFVLDFDDEYCEYNMKQFLSFFTRNDPRKNLPKRNNNPFNFVNKFQGYMAWQNSEIKKKVNLLSKPFNNPIYYNQNSYLWLLKPTGLNRGRGIQIFDSLEQLQKILGDYLTLMNRKKLKEKTKEGDDNFIESKVCSQKFKINACSFVVQKYVEKPFLIQGRKFDIRVWVLLTEKLQVFSFKEGYIRTSAEAYSTEDIGNYFVHLTNNAIQKHSQNYGQFENANQLSFRDLERYMPKENVGGIWERIKQITFMVFSSVKRKINASQRRHCFQLFGMDFFIDQLLKVWLIEVNQNPCIQCSSPLLGMLIPRMISDAFKLTLDQIVEKRPEQKAYPVKGYADQENMWQSIGFLTPNSQYLPKKDQK